MLKYSWCAVFRILEWVNFTANTLQHAPHSSVHCVTLMYVCPLSRFGRPLSKTVYAHSSFDTKHIWLGPWPHRVSGKRTAAPLSHSVGSPQHLLETNIPKIKSMYSDTTSWEQTKFKGSASHRKNSFSIEHWYKNQETTRFWWLLPENYCRYSFNIWCHKIVTLVF